MAKRGADNKVVSTTNTRTNNGPIRYLSVMSSVVVVVVFLKKKRGSTYLFSLDRPSFM